MQHFMKKYCTAGDSEKIYQQPVISIAEIIQKIQQVNRVED